MDETGADYTEWSKLERKTPIQYTNTYILEKAMAPHSSTLAWKIPWMEEPGRPQSMGSLRVGHDWATLLSLFTFMHWRRKWQPTPVFLPGESQGQGSLVAAVYGVAQSQTRLKRLSSSSSLLLPVLCLEIQIFIFVFLPTTYLSIYQYICISVLVEVY